MMLMFMIVMMLIFMILMMVMFMTVMMLMIMPAFTVMFLCYFFSGHPDSEVVSLPATAIFTHIIDFK
jgi:hypothetical protein